MKTQELNRKWDKSTARWASTATWNSFRRYRHSTIMNGDFLSFLYQTLCNEEDMRDNRSFSDLHIIPVHTPTRRIPQFDSQAWLIKRDSFPKFVASIHVRIVIFLRLKRIPSTTCIAPVFQECRPCHWLQVVCLLPCVESPLPHTQQQHFLQEYQQ